MTRETRYNLIFLCVLIPLLIPGGIILFRAKLDPEARVMFKPDTARRDSVYINYDDSRPAGSRVVPPITGQWVQFETERLIHPGIRQHMHWQKGLASEHHRYEVVGIARSNDQGSFLAVMVWDPKVVAPAFTLGDEAMTLVSQHALEVAPKVRAELQNEGFVLPPQRITAYLLQAPTLAQGQTLTAHYHRPGHEPETESVTLPEILR